MIYLLDNKCTLNLEKVNTLSNSNTLPISQLHLRQHPFTSLLHCFTTES